MIVSDKSIDRADDPQDEMGATLIQALVLPAAICAFGLTLFWSLPSSAQSFSCAAAERSAEFAICNDETLQQLDQEIGALIRARFEEAETRPQRQATSREHNDWLKKRNACGSDLTCLNLRYEERLSTLSQRRS